MPEPTPSNYVPLGRVRRQNGAPREQVTLEAFLPGRWSGSLSLTYSPIDPVRVGSGVLFPRPVRGQTELVQDLTLVRGRPVLPGSSVKGAIRSLVEAIGGGCDLQGTCQPLCVACSLFGTVQKDSKSWKGRVGFDDALPVKDVQLGLDRLPRAFPPKATVGRRAYGPAPEGIQGENPYFVIVPGSTLRGRLLIHNLDDAELGLVLTACGLDGSFAPRLGGGKYHGLGRTRIEVTSARLRRGPGRPQVLCGAELDERVSLWLKAWQPPEGADQVLGVLRKQMGVR